MLAVTGLGDDLAAARGTRTSAWRRSTSTACRCAATSAGGRSAPSLTSYAAAGVDIDEGTRAVSTDEGGRRAHARHRRARAASAASAACSSAKPIKAMDDPVLVASTDGVGTKVELAARLGRYRGVGHRHRQPLHRRRAGAGRPAAVLPRLHRRAASSTPTTSPRSSRGMAEACEAAGCALLGGETAEMPGVYAPGAFDIAGTLVGVVERADAAPPRRHRRRRRAGRRRLAAARTPTATRSCASCSSGCRWTPHRAGFDRPLGETLLEPHRIVPRRARRRRSTRGMVKALAHITGGGLPENLPRVLPDGVDARHRARFVAGAAAVPPGARSWRPAMATDELLPHAEHGHRHGRRVRPRRRRPTSRRRSPSRPG